jgi:hypothetical protein
VPQLEWNNKYLSDWGDERPSAASSLKISIKIKVPQVSNREMHQAVSLTIKLNHQSAQQPNYKVTRESHCSYLLTPLDLSRMALMAKARTKHTQSNGSEKYRDVRMLICCMLSCDLG